MSNDDTIAEHAQKLAKARQELDKEFEDARKKLGELHLAYQAVTQAGPEDNLHDLLKNLEKEAKKARDGGVIGSGSNSHRRALKKYTELNTTLPPT